MEICWHFVKKSLFFNNTTYYWIRFFFLYIGGENNFISPCIVIMKSDRRPYCRSTETSRHLLIVTEENHKNLCIVYSCRTCLRYVTDITTWDSLWCRYSPSLIKIKNLYVQTSFSNCPRYRNTVRTNSVVLFETSVLKIYTAVMFCFMTMRVVQTVSEDVRTTWRRVMSWRYRSTQSSSRQ